jgi:hypothetical protein
VKAHGILGIFFVMGFPYLYSPIWIGSKGLSVLEKGFDNKNRGDETYLIATSPHCPVLRVKSE